MAPAHPIHLFLIALSGFVLVNAISSQLVCPILQQFENSPSSSPDELKRCFTMMDVNIDGTNWWKMTHLNLTQVGNLKAVSAVMCRNIHKIKPGVDCFINTLKKECSEYMAENSKWINVDHFDDFLEFFCQHSNEVYTPENIKCMVNAVTPDKARVCKHTYEQRQKAIISDGTKTPEEKAAATNCLLWSTAYACEHEFYAQCGEVVEDFSAELIALLQPSSCPALNSGVRMHAELTALFAIASVFIWMTRLP